MASKTKIEWTDFNWNFLRGCSRVSEGCRNCYAEKIAARFSEPGQAFYGIAKRRAFVGDKRSNWTGEISFHEEILLEPLKWKKPRRVFVNSMSDLFHEKVTDEMLDKAFAVMALTPQHTFQILTKRPERMLKYLTAPSIRFPNSTEPRPEISYRLALLTDLGDKQSIQRTADAQNRLCHGGWPLPNVWLGVSVEDQKTADERIPLLLQTPAAVRWISAEPLLGPVNISRILLKKSDRPENGKPDLTFNALKGWHGGANVNNRTRLDWVVIGGESGPGARPFNIEWARSIVQQCKATNVPVFVKQLGAKPFIHQQSSVNFQRDGVSLQIESIEYDSTFSLNNRKGGDPSEWPEDLRVREFPEVHARA
jgi:protein gp37